jgi:hypothetical protein
MKKNYYVRILLNCAIIIELIQSRPLKVTIDPTAVLCSIFA